MKTIVLSAFKTFGDYVANPTEIVARHLHKTTAGEFVIHSILFDANIPKRNRGADLFSAAQKLHASGIISLGMASEKTGLCIECVSTNKIHNLKYCPTHLNGTAINRDRPYEESLHMDLQAWNIELFKKSCAEKNIPVMEDSTDAGGFCCNHLAYQSRVAQMNSDAWSRIPFIFIHTPCSPETLSDIQTFYSTGKVAMSTDKIIDGIKLLLSSAAL